MRTGLYERPQRYDLMPRLVGITQRPKRPDQSAETEHSWVETIQRSVRVMPLAVVAHKTFLEMRVRREELAADETGIAERQMGLK